MEHDWAANVMWQPVSSPNQMGIAPDAHRNVGLSKSSIAATWAEVKHHCIYDQNSGLMTLCRRDMSVYAVAAGYFGRLVVE
jgi:hypothetical protein